MKSHVFNRLLRLAALGIGSGACALGQGTFQNLGFEAGTFITIPGDPFGRVQFSAAMPGWTGYLGTTQIDWILHNNLFLSNPGIAIFGPDNPVADAMQGHYYVQLKNSFPVATDVPAIAQTGMLPADAHSVRFLSFGPFAVGFQVFVANTAIPLYHLGSGSNGTEIWGGDITRFAGQNVELRFRGADFLDDIRFSSVPIPEPASETLFALGITVWLWPKVKGRRK